MKKNSWIRDLMIAVSFGYCLGDFIFKLINMTITNLMYW